MRWGWSGGGVRWGGVGGGGGVEVGGVGIISDVC